MAFFDDSQRSDASPERYSEPVVTFLDRVDRMPFAEVRSLLNRWLSEYCPEGQSDIRGRMWSRDDRQFHAAFWELYLHQCMIRGGWDVVCHPTLLNTTRRPDFLATRDGKSFLLEARLAWKAEQERATEARIGRLFEAVNNIKSPNFFLDVSVERFGELEPSKLRSLKRSIEAWLEDLDPDNIETEVGTDRVSQLPTFCWQHEEWRLEFTAIPISAEYRGASDNRPIGMSSGPGGRIDGVEPLRLALAEKVHAYGGAGQPFAIAIRTDWRTDQQDVISALFGTRQIAYTQGRGSNNRVWRVRSNNGLWSDGRNAHISAVLVCNDILPWTVASSVPTLWENPHAAYPTLFSDAWDRAIWSEADLKVIPAKRSISEMLGLPGSWPGFAT